MNWDTILQVVLALLSNCHDDDVKTISQRIRQPDGLLRWRLESRVRRSLGIRPAEWRKSERDAIMPSVYSRAAEATDDEIIDLIDESRDQWLDLR